MRSYFYILSAITASLVTTIASASPSQVACTREYVPVCGSVQVQCIKSPCDPVKQTFSNNCVAKAAGATNIQTGSCESAIPPVVVGGDKDKYGCIGSAGYSWNSQARKCLRPWESKIRVITVDSVKKSCTGVAPMECMQVKIGTEKQWSNFYNDIKGFDFVSGYTYRLLVLEEKIENPPMDASNVSYKLIRLINKKLVSTPTSNSDTIIGKWNLVYFNTKEVDSSKFTGNFTNKNFSMKFCNMINGSYTLSNNTFIAPNAASTMMYCEWLPMTLENAWNLDGATYSLVSLRRMPGSYGPTMHLIITTKKWDRFTFGN
jgi:heat shock protein HslJ